MQPASAGWLLSFFLVALLLTQFRLPPWGKAAWARPLLGRRAHDGVQLPALSDSLMNASHLLSLTSTPSTPASSATVYEALLRASSLLGHLPAAHKTASGGAQHHISAELRNITRDWVSAAGGSIGSCGLDVSLLEALQQQLQGRRVMIVSNLRDSEQLLPHFMQQLLTAAAVLPGEVFVSGLQHATAALTTYVHTGGCRRGLEPPRPRAAVYRR
jgi:hypothetical protein